MICVMFSFDIYFIEMQHILNLRGAIMKSLTEKEEREHYEKIMGWIGKVVWYMLQSGDIFHREDLIEELRQHKREAPTKEIKKLLDEAIKKVQR